MTKEEKIKESWGAAYGGDMDENGWKPLNKVYITSTLEIEHSECGTMEVQNTPYSSEKLKKLKFNLVLFKILITYLIFKKYLS